MTSLVTTSKISVEMLVKTFTVINKEMKIFLKKIIMIRMGIINELKLCYSNQVKIYLFFI